MSTIRGRALKFGGMATEPAGFSIRTSSGGGVGGDQNTLLNRPAYQSPQGTFFSPAGAAAGALPGGLGSLLDLRGITSRRIFWVLVAAAYIGVFHITLDGFSLGRRGLATIGR